MRRRPKADAPSPSSAAATAAEDVAIAPAVADTADAPNPAAEPLVIPAASADNAEPANTSETSETSDAPKPRRRAASPRRAKAAAVEPETPVVADAEAPPALPVVSEPEPAAKEPEETLPAAKPKRTPRRRANAAEAPAAEVQTADVSVPETVNTQAVAAETPATEEALPSPSPRSRGRKRATPAATATEATTPSEPAVVEEPVLPLLDVPTPRDNEQSASQETEADSSDASDAAAQTLPSRSSRRRSNRRASAAASAAAAAEAAQETPAAAAEAVVPTAENTPPTEESPASSRRRGRQRRTPTETTETTETAPVVQAAPPAAPTPPRSRQRERNASPPAASGAEDATPNAAPATPSAGEPAAPRRVRGLPRRRETAVSSGAETAPTTGAAASPLTGRTAAAGVSLAPVVDPLPPPYQALPAEVLARLPDVRVQSVKNRPQLTVNGEARLPFWFFVNTQDEESVPVAIREIRMAYEAGIRFFTLLVHLPWKTRTGERRFGPLDDVLQMIAENAPDALFVPRLIFSPPTSWERANPSEMSRYANDGETGDVSFASRAFWEGEADEALRAAVEYVAQSEHAHRIAGFYLEHGEWLHEKERGADISEANTTGFRAWLKTKYKQLVNLRAAWHDGSVTFENAAIPAENPTTASFTLFWSDRQQKWADFAQYTSETAASVIVRLAKSAKEASGNRSLVAVSYGYSLEIMRGNSGHLDLARVLASPHVDVLTGPISYSGRAPGGSAPLPVPLDSVHLAGKLWISEDDTKTFLASGDTPDPYNPKIAAPEGAWAAHSRNFGAALARGAGLSWMDLWGEGWLDDRYVWQNIAHLNDIAGRLARLRQTGASDIRVDDGPDVAVFVDERSFFDIPPASEVFLSRLVTDQRDVLLRSGAKIGFYLLSDLLHPDFPQTPRLLLFLNAFHLPDAIKAAIKKQQDSGRTFAWLFGPGCRDETPGDVDTVGIQLKVQPWGSKTGTTVSSTVRSPLTENLRGQKLGDELRTNPSYFVNDPKATVLGEYASGLPSMGYRKHGRWQSVFLGEPVLTLPLLRGLFRLAGVPVATVDDDVAVLGDGLLSLHSAPGGGTTVFLPDDLVLLDLLTNETVSSGGFGSRLSMPPQGSRLLFAGSPADVRALGGDPDAAPYGLSTDELPPPPAAFVFDAPLLPAPVAAAVAVPPSVLTPPPFVGRGRQNRPNPTPAPVAPVAEAASPEDADLMEAAFLQADFSLADKEAGGDDEDEAAIAGGAATETAPASVVSASEADAKKKRRRRRRGPNKAQEADTETSADDEADAVLADNENEAEGDLFAGELEPDISEPETNVSSDEGEGVATPSTVLPVPPGPPVRLTLEELLPQSTVTEETGDLPPIPDELLPLDSRTLPAANNSESEASVEETAAEPVRKRRGRPRRTPTAADTAPSETAAPDTLELE